VGTAVGVGAAAVTAGVGVGVTAAVVTVIESVFEAVVADGFESVTVTVKLKVPAVVHVPVIAPLEARLRPGGSAPLNDHV
jgi:hypothetical protein